MHAAVAHVHAIDNGITKRPAALNHSPAHSPRNVGHQVLWSITASTVRHWCHHSAFGFRITPTGLWRIPESKVAPLQIGDIMVNGDSIRVP